MDREDNKTVTLDEALDGWNLEGLDFPSVRISLLAKVMDRLTNRHLEVPIAEWRVLCRLALSKGGLTVREIATNAWVDRAEVSRAASSLEERGYLVRRDNPADRRAPIMHLTAAGKEVYKPLMAQRVAFHDRILRSFTQDEQDALDTLLRKVAVNLLDMSYEFVREAE